MARSTHSPETSTAQRSNGLGLEPKPENPSSLHDFAVAFFQLFDSEIQPADGRQQGALRVTLSPELASHFGKPALHLVFQNAELSGETDLVAYGSRVFDLMMAYLNRQGAVTVQSLPGRHGDPDALLRAIRPRNAAITNLQMQEQDRLLFAFNWHITYRSDDKHEEIYTVLLDEDSRLLPAFAPNGGGGTSAHNGAQNATRDVTGLDAMLADAQPPAQQFNAEGRPVPPRLPPMTHLVRLAEAARKYALYHADVRCVAYEKEILPRLYKVLKRLTTYYEQQIQETYDAHDPTGEKRLALEEDLQRKLAEEVENHRLRVQVRLFSYAILEMPVASATITLGDGQQEVQIRVVRNRYSGSLERPACHVCHQEMEEVVLCRNGHVSCPGCTAQCQHCQDIVCTTCGVERCPVCEQDNCERCGEMCWACGERACPEHVSACPICGDAVCQACQTACAECGVVQCRSHLRADSVSGALICAACAVRCPGCRQFSAHLETCSASGQRFCTGCMVSCAGCGARCGPGFYEFEPLNGQAYCQACLQVCPTCGQLTGAIDERGCKVCGAPSCSHCVQACTTCQARLCADHAAYCDHCRATLCAEHVLTCRIGQEKLCSGCAETCAICGRHHCREHTSRCQLCLQNYCTECVRSTGLCDSCASLEREIQPLGPEDVELREHPKVERWMAKYRWGKVANLHYTLYWGTDMWGNHALIVARAGEVLQVRRSNFLDRLLGRGWR